MRRAIEPAFVSLGCVFAFAVAGPALAQSEGDVKVLSNWSYDPIYSEGWSIENMFDVTDVVDANGEVIGDVENVILSNEGEVLGIIAEVGGFWDIGDTHVHVPWNEVEITSLDELTLPITEETVGDYDVFGDYWDDEQLIAEGDVDATQPVNDDLVAGAGIFKATDLIGDYVYLSEGARYGYVSDILVQDGTVAAIVMDAAAYGRPGYYAYPYTRGVYSPGGRYDMPYEAGQIDTIEDFDYQQLQSRVE